MPETPLSLMRTALEIAQPAANLLSSHFDRLSSSQVQTKGNARDLITVADMQSEATVIQGILERFPHHGVLAEEDGLILPDGWPKGSDGGAATCPEYMWVIDPLDGTMNFARSFPAFAVSVGVLRRGIPVAGVVWAPRLGEVFAAAQGEGAWMLSSHGDALGEWDKLAKRIGVTKRDELGACLLATGFSYVRNKVVKNNVDNFSRLVLAAADIRRAGAASLDLAYVAAGRFDGYWEAYLQPWDVAAGGLIVQEAGGFVSDFAGSAEAKDWLWTENLVASNGLIHSELRGALSGTEDGYLLRHRALARVIGSE